MNTENLSTLKIHKLTQAQYDRELEAGNIDANALYLTPEEEIDLSPYATKTEVEQLKTSVSEGKALVAAAVTDKGVITAADATFATIADNIRNISSGYKVIDINDDDITVTQGDDHTEITIPNSANLSSITALEFGGSLSKTSDSFYFARRKSSTTIEDGVSYSCPYLCVCDGYDYNVHEECGSTTIKYTILDNGDVWTYLNDNDLTNPTDWNYITGKIVGI